VVLQPGQPVVVLQQPAATAPAPAAAADTAHAAHSQPAPHATFHDHPVSHTEEKAAAEQELIFYSHSNFLYWWPVWAVGYTMALITWFRAQPVQIGDAQVLIDPNKNLGVLFTLTFFLVMLVTTVTLRGMASVVTILGAALAALLLAYFGWWGVLLDWMGQVRIYMNMGFYVFFSTLVFIVWAFSTFVYDHMSYWKVRPGQITHERVIGGAEKSYDTRGMVFEKHREDLFRHWVLGMGSGDIQISTMGAKRETLYVPNVLNVNAKIDAIQRMIAAKPTEFTAPTA
jgi:hypothetical protein